MRKMPGSKDALPKDACPAVKDTLPNGIALVPAGFKSLEPVN
jgi:hypothetical protein